MKQNNVPSADILNCLANLSSDEVFTSPELANRMLDLLPQELFSNPKTTFLDPCCKSGVFLREIAKRLLKGLEKEIPDLQRRIDHIMSKQVFGIAITMLTAEMSRRTLYCTKKADGEYSVATCFKGEQGNLRYMRCEHTWDNGKCACCGANRVQYDRVETIENYAYPFIHKNINEIFKKDMQFDVIIGNPPYQLSDGGAQASAIPIYHKFIQQSIKLKPKYLVMIVPSRWMTGGRGLDSFRNDMLHDKRLAVVHDFKDASLCFSGVEIKGGVNYFLWDREKKSDLCLVINDYGNGDLYECQRTLLEDGSDVFIRNNRLIPILKKVIRKKEQSFSNIVSPMKPFGLRGDFFKHPSKYELPDISDDWIANGYTIYGLNDSLKRCCKYVKRNYPLPKKDNLNKFKLFMSRNQGEGELGETFVQPIFAKPNECCTETFVVIGGFDTEKEMMNCWSYMKTKFFRTMLGMKKNDQGCGQAVYQFVPLQDFSHPWTDEMLYKKYGLDDKEIAFIESMIKPME